LKSIPEQLRAALQQMRSAHSLFGGSGLGRTTPNGHAVQAALVIGDARSHAPDLLLGSLDLMLTGHVLEKRVHDEATLNLVHRLDATVGTMSAMLVFRL
jgi:hypothetical protein